MNQSLVATPPPAPVSRATVLKISYKVLMRRCHALGITRHEVWQCARVADVQTLAKVRYHVLARRYHPDAQARRQALGLRTPLTGNKFRRITRTYTWIMGLPGWQSLDLWYWAPITDAILPWAMERPPLRLGAGWQEVFF